MARAVFKYLLIYIIAASESYVNASRSLGSITEEQLPLILSQLSNDPRLYQKTLFISDQGQSYKLHVIAEDNDYVVVDKPEGMIVYTTERRSISLGGRPDATVEDFIKLYRKSRNLPGQIDFGHRIDQKTSGLLVIPLHATALANMKDQLYRRQARKYYLALLHGTLDIRTRQENLDVTRSYLKLDMPIRKNNAGSYQGVVPDRDFPYIPRHEIQASETHLHVLHNVSYDGEQCTLVLLKPITGRRHQLRSHCSYIGHPIVNDPIYKRPHDRISGRMWLHAWQFEMYNRDADRTYRWKTRLPWLSGEDGRTAIWEDNDGMPTQLLQPLSRDDLFYTSN